MGWIQLGISVITLVVKLFDAWLDRDAERKKKKKEILDDTRKAITERDPGRITANFDRLRRLR